MIPRQIADLFPWAGRIARDKAGTTAIEFALLAPVFLTLTMGGLDFGHSIYAKAELIGAVQQAARSSTMEGADASAADDMVRSYMAAIAPNVTVSSVRYNYYDFTDVGRAERWNDLDSSGRCDNAESYVDENENGKWDADIGRSGNGGASDVVLYEVTATYKSPFSVPFMPQGWEMRSIKASTTLKNQPYSNQNAYGFSTGVC